MNFLKKLKPRKRSSWVYEGERYKQSVLSNRARRSDFIAVVVFLVLIVALVVWLNM